ncbi:MAG: DUF4278 domain-containing protein [Cyanobacteria bacterium]|nr:DUF4278 domain-containing protein [Cyanobacteriota bacterium]MDA0865855.1 DUF4278 domain-containing protein [Cyanobacteriota bacterium]
MQLSYRGHHYEAQLPKLDQDGLEEIGVYRGAPLKRKHFHLAARHHGTVELTYRGVKYAHEM